MLKTSGLYTYILNNNLKSLILLCGFQLVTQLMAASVWAFYGLFMPEAQGFASLLGYVLAMTWHYAPVVLAGSLAWSAFAFLYYKRLVRDMTGLRSVTRLDEPRLYNVVENLSIATGLTTPAIEISESLAMNAFAMGLRPQASTIGVTRGLLNGLNDKELEAVIAHELTHIRTRDVRMMTFATIFSGIIFSVGWFLTYRMREAYRQSNTGLLKLLPFVFVLVLLMAFAWQGLGLMAGFIMSALGAGLALRFAISRTREFVADAGACELTKNPEALISALVKIHGRSLVPGCDVMVRSMMISAPAEGLMATHPSLEQRIDAIVAFAAHHLNGLRLAPAAARALPQADADVAMNTGFSVTAMKYPAWVSKPIVVAPAILAAILAYAVRDHGVEGALQGLLQTPQFAADLFKAPLEGAARKLGSDDAAPGGGLFGMGMGLGDLNAFLMLLAIAVPISIAARLLRRLGFDSRLLREATGAPSKEMESDWIEDTPAQNETRLNAAMARRISQFAAESSAPPPAPGFMPARPSDQRPVFSKAVR
jgi:heat shock protein HtpX